MRLPSFPLSPLNLLKEPLWETPPTLKPLPRCVLGLPSHALIRVSCTGRASLLPISVPLHTPFPRPGMLVHKPIICLLGPATLTPQVWPSRPSSWAALLTAPLPCHQASQFLHQTLSEPCPFYPNADQIAIWWLLSSTSRRKNCNRDSVCPGHQGTNSMAQYLGGPRQILQNEWSNEGTDGSMDEHRAKSHPRKRWGGLPWWCSG